MQKMAVVKTGGKQYLVKANDELVVEKLSGNPKDTVELETLALLDEKGVELGVPSLSKPVKATIIETAKGEKVRIARFKAKARYRRVKGFRPMLTKIKINEI